MNAKIKEKHVVSNYFALHSRPKPSISYPYPISYTYSYPY